MKRGAILILCLLAVVCTGVRAEIPFHAVPLQLTENEKTIWQAWLRKQDPNIQQMILTQGFPKNPERLSAESKQRWEDFKKANPAEINAIIDRWVAALPPDPTPEERLAKQKVEAEAMRRVYKQNLSDLLAFLQRNRVTIQVEDMAPIELNADMILTAEGIAIIDGKLVVDHALVDSKYTFAPEKVSNLNEFVGKTFYQYQFALGIDRNEQGDAVLVFRTHISQALSGLDPEAEEGDPEDAIMARRTNIALPAGILTTSPDQLPSKTRSFTHNYKKVGFKLTVTSDGKSVEKATSTPIARFFEKTDGATQ